MLASTMNNGAEQRWVVDAVKINFFALNPNNWFIRNVFFAQVTEGKKSIYFYYLLIHGNIEEVPTIFLQPEPLDNKDNVFEGNDHPESVMVMKMAEKIEACKGVFGTIRLISSDSNIKLTTIFF